VAIERDGLADSVPDLLVLMLEDAVREELTVPEDVTETLALFEELMVGLDVLELAMLFVEVADSVGVRDPDVVGDPDRVVLVDWLAWVVVVAVLDRAALAVTLGLRVLVRLPDAELTEL
jgi:hypothetical protein